MKDFIKKFIFHWISQFMVFKIFPNCIPLYQRHHTIFYVKKNHSDKHNESKIIWYELWHKVFGISKVQHVMVIQNLFIKYIQCDHIACNLFFKSYSQFFHSYFVPWPMIDNPTNCDMIMYSTLKCFHPIPLFPCGRNWQFHLLFDLYNMSVNHERPTIRYQAVS
jgi:hypothetical protein